MKRESTHCAKFSTLSLQASSCKSEYHHGSAFIAKEGDKVEIGGHVILTHSSLCTTVIGRVREILISDLHRRAVSHVAVQLFIFARNVHPLLHMPCVELQ